MSNGNLNIFGTTIETNESLGLSGVDRRRHMLIIGKSGTGKTTLLIQMIVNDIKARRSVIFFDPFGELHDRVLPLIPEEDKDRVKALVVSDKQSFDAFLQMEFLDEQRLTENIKQQKIWSVRFSRPKLGDAIAEMGQNFLQVFLAQAIKVQAALQEAERSDIYLYVDEMPGFSTDWLNGLPDFRAFKINIIITLQYLEQLPASVRDLVLGNIGNVISFAVGQFDAEILSPLLLPNASAPAINDLAHQLLHLAEYHFMASLLKDGKDQLVVEAQVLE